MTTTISSTPVTRHRHTEPSPRNQVASGSGPSETWTPSDQPDDLAAQQAFLKSQRGASSPDAQVRGLVAGADSNSLFHATHSGSLDGIFKAGGLVPASEMEGLGITRQSGEGTAVNPYGGRRNFISFGSGQVGLGSALKYSETLLDPPASLARVSDQDLGRQVSDYQAMLGHEDMARVTKEDLPGVDGVIRTRLQEAEAELASRKANPGKPEPYPVMFGIRGDDLEKTQSVDVRGEVRVQSGVSFKDKLESAFAPREHLPELKAKLDEMLGPEHGVKVLPLESLQRVKTEFPDMTYGHKSTSGAVDSFGGWIEDAREQLLGEAPPPRTTTPDAGGGGGRPGIGKRILNRLGFLGGAAATLWTAGTTSGNATEVAAATGETAVEMMVPGGYSALKVAEGRGQEAAMGAVEEIPLLGMLATEVARPVARAMGANVDPSILESGMADAESQRKLRQANNASLRSWVQEVGASPERPITGVDLVRVDAATPAEQRPEVHFMIDGQGRLRSMVDAEEPISRHRIEALNEGKLVVGVERPSDREAPITSEQAYTTQKFMDGLMLEHYLSGFNVDWPNSFTPREQQRLQGH